MRSRWRFSISYRAAPLERYAPGAFDRMVGEPVAVNLEGHGKFRGTCLRAEVEPGGRAVRLTFEVEAEPL